MQSKLLIIPDKPDIERDAVAEAWQDGKVLRVGKFWVKPDIPHRRIALYGYDTFCLVLAQVLELELVVPKDELIVELDKKWTKRSIILKKIEDIVATDFPIFLKPVIPKQFIGKVYSNLTDFQTATEGLNTNEQIMTSEIIEVIAEARCFVLKGVVKSIALYEGEGNIRAATTFANDFLKHHPTLFPITFVLDLGLNAQNEWFVLEFNATWGAGLNGCDPNAVLECIENATI